MSSHKECVFTGSVKAAKPSTKMCACLWVRPVAAQWTGDVHFVSYSKNNGTLALVVKENIPCTHLYNIMHLCAPKSKCIIAYSMYWKHPHACGEYVTCWGRSMCNLCNYSLVRYGKYPMFIENAKTNEEQYYPSCSFSIPAKCVDSTDIFA